MNTKKGNRTKKSCLSMLMLAIMCAIMLHYTGFVADNVYAADTGYTQIATAADLLKIADNPDGNYILANDIDLSGAAFDDCYMDVVFNGTLNGNGKTISGVQQYIFKETGEAAVIENLNINGTLKMEGEYIDVGVTGEYVYIGLGVYHNNGTIRNCDFNAVATAKAGQLVYVGIVTFYNYGIIEDCDVQLSFNTEGNIECGFLGGIAYMNVQMIRNCTVSGNVSASVSYKALEFGGMAHTSVNGDFEGCTNYCNASGNVSSAGIVVLCETNSSISDCANYGNFDIQNFETLGWAVKASAGIVSWAKGCVKNCTNYGDISVSGYDAYAGGIVGKNHMGNVIIDSCVNNGDITGWEHNGCAGGICGDISYYQGTFSVMDQFIPVAGISIIKNCTNNGQVITAGNITNYVLGGGGHYGDSKIIIDNSKSYVDGAEYPVSSNSDDITVNKTDSRVNINEDNIVMLYNEEAQLTGDINKAGVKLYSSDITVSENGLVKGDCAGDIVQLVGSLDTILKTYVVMIDEQTNATDYCEVEVRNGEVTYTYENGVLTFSGNGIIPEVQSSYDWDKYAYTTTKIVVEDGVSSIPISAFYYFVNVESVELADSVVFIGPSAFYGCKKLKSIDLPDNLYSLQGSAFGCTGIESITIPSGLYEMFHNSFSGCEQLKSIHFEGERTYGIFIDRYAFAGCPALEEITVPEGCYSLEVIDGVLYQNTNAGKRLLCYPVAKIGDDYTLPEDVTYIYSGAITECKYLKNFYGGSGVRTIENDNFINCPQLNKLVISENVDYFGVNFDEIDYISSIENKSNLTISLGSNYSYALASTGEPVTQLQAGQTAVRKVSSITLPNGSLSAMGVLKLAQDRTNVFAGMVVENTAGAILEYRWTARNKTLGTTAVVQDWTENNEWLSWNPTSFGEYELIAEARLKDSAGAVVSTTSEAFEFNPHIKGKCQMPYWGEGGGYLIGVESYENPNQSYQYEMLIYDCTYATWVYTTNKFTVTDGAAGWCVWQPEYGYYWTLFRVYDAEGNMIDQACYPFVNAY